MITVDATSSSGSQSTVSSFSFNHTCSAGPSSVLVVSVNVSDNVNATSSSVTGVTYNGVAMTKIASQLDGASLGQYASLWLLINPSSGTNSVAVTLAAAMSRSCAGGISVLNAHQVTQPDASTTATASIQNPSNTLTSSINNTFLIDSISITGSVTLTGPNVGQTAVYNTALLTGAAGMSYRSIPGSPNSAAAVGWIDSATRTYSQVIAAIEPTSGGSFRVNSLRPHVFSPGLAR